MKRVLGDITAQTSSDENHLLSAPKEKRPRGRPRGWRKMKMDPNQEIILPVMTPNMDTNSSGSGNEGSERSRGRPVSVTSREPKEEDQWSVRIRTSIKGAMLEHLAKGKSLITVRWRLIPTGELPPMCFCCGDIQPASWRYHMVEDEQVRFCNGNLHPPPNDKSD